MNSFNRLLSLYIDLFLIEEILYDYNRKMLKISFFQEKCLYLQYRKKQLKLKIMEKEAKTLRKERYRITIILEDEVIVEKFNTRYVAESTIKDMKKLFPSRFIGAALEEKNKDWRVIWVLGNH